MFGTPQMLDSLLFDIYLLRRADFKPLQYMQQAAIVGPEILARPLCDVT